MFLNTSHFVKEECFDSSFCKNIIQQGDNKTLEQAKITDGNSNNRKSKITWINNQELISQITPIINQSNTDSNWNFLLREFEPLQYTTYNKNDHYDWHIDSHAKPYDNGLIRKLSFTVCLNEDYTGGNFELSIPHPVSKKTKHFKFTKVFKPGTIIIFPSFVWHKVHPVLSGVRKVLVGWVVGKSFV